MLNIIILIVLSVFVLVVFCIYCSFRNIGAIKCNAGQTWSANGFKIVGYQGYEPGPFIPFTSYGGALVWYTLKKVPDNGILYDGSLQRWGNEYHVYRLGAVDAIKPQGE